jgi:predicted nucleic acid-binding protein
LTLVVDTSVVLKIYVEEPESERAEALVGGDLVAPDWVLAEVANALWKKVMKGEITSDHAIGVLPQLSEAVALYPAAELSEPALEAALELRHPVYDGLFLVLAEQLSADLVTADLRLIDACRGTRFESRIRRL